MNMSYRKAGSALLVVLGFLNKESFMPTRCPEVICDLFEKFINNQ